MRAALLGSLGVHLGLTWALVACPLPDRPERPLPALALASGAALQVEILERSPPLAPQPEPEPPPPDPPVAAPAAKEAPPPRPAPRRRARSAVAPAAKHPAQATPAAAAPPRPSGPPSPSPPATASASASTLAAALAAPAAAPGPATSAACADPPARPAVLERPRRITYAEAARARGVQGRLVLEVQVATDGRVRGVQVAQGLHPELDAEAVAAVRTWRFRPARRCGQPVEGSYRLARRFELGD